MFDNWQFYITDRAQLTEVISMASKLKSLETTTVEAMTTCIHVTSNLNYSNSHNKENKHCCLSESWMNDQYIRFDVTGVEQTIHMTTAKWMHNSIYCHNKLSSFLELEILLSYLHFAFDYFAHIQRIVQINLSMLVFVRSKSKTKNAWAQFKKVLE